MGGSSERTMHHPSAIPRASVFYGYPVYPYRRSPEMDGDGAARTVVIVGAGPIGLATALDLARFRIPCVVLEEDLQVCEGSRAIVLTRRSLEILQQLGVEKPFIDKGLPWSQGRSFFRGVEVYRMLMPHEADDRYLPGLNIQQQYIEEYLLRACEQRALIEVRWGQRLIGLSQDEHGALLEIDTPEGSYRLAARWVVTADGGRSTVRKLLHLRMEGRSYPAQFVIADIKARISLPTERLCFFDPPWNPGANILVHRQPDDLWRIDYRLPQGESRERALEPALLEERINAVLRMIHQEVDWQLDWATVYSANALTLGDYVHGRVLLTGDAAHLLPIFGVRGINTGLQDGNNLAWKLAFVIKGWAAPPARELFARARAGGARDLRGGRQEHALHGAAHRRLTSAARCRAVLLALRGIPQGSHALAHGACARLPRLAAQCRTRGRCCIRRWHRLWAGVAQRQDRRGGLSLRSLRFPGGLSPPAVRGSRAARRAASRHSAGGERHLPSPARVGDRPGRLAAHRSGRHH